ncbi:hypothetical protein [Haliea sp.]|uniref:hypothetical protein n=1 Tax=Haliea sp. TaxID=1932666 RepID=UPI0025C57C04|nr:hypothetical protein [Haliea sp.]
MPTSPSASIVRNLRPRWVVVCLLCVAVVFYAANAGDDFLFDDTPALSGNELVQISGERFDEWRTAAFSSSAGPLSRPLTMVTFALQHALEGGFSARSLKLGNIVIHLVIAGLLFLLFRALVAALVAQGKLRCDPGWVAALAMGFWLLHPLHVSTVLYAVQRMAQLSTLFTVLGLLLFVRWRSRWAERGASPQEVVAAALWLLLVTLFAVLSKENGALLLWLVPAVEVAVYRGRWAGQQRSPLAAAGWVLLLLPLVAIALIFWFAPETFLGGYTQRNFTLEERLLTQGRVLWQYVSWIVWPNILSMGFQHDDLALSTGWLQPVSTLLALAGWVSVLVVAVWRREHWPLLLLAVLVYLVGHSMESSFLALEMVYEHRNYLPSIGICLLLGVGFASVLDRLPASRRVPALLALFAAFALLLGLRGNTWSDDLTLSRTNLARHPESVRSNYFYGNALLRQYRLRDELGLTEAEARASLAVGRHYMELMHQRDPADLGALVMLYYLDSLFFPELGAQTDWLSALHAALPGRVLKASDRNALQVLAECMGDGKCATQDEEVERLFAALGRYSLTPTDLDSLRYTYLQARGAPPEALLAALEAALARSPGQLAYYPYLIARYSEVGDAEGVLRSIGEWMHYDSRRRQLPLQRQVVAGADQ